VRRRRPRDPIPPPAWAAERLWLAQAACAGQLEVFYPPDYLESRGERVARELRARAICAACPVIEACRALVDRIETSRPYEHHHGIWAGETPVERKRRRASSREEALAG